MEPEGGTTEVEITIEVAQGSVSSPTIWNIHYDEFLRLKLPKDVTQQWDDAEHAFIHCRTYMEVRAQLQQRIGAFSKPETLVEIMLRGPKSWTKLRATSGT